MAYIVILVILAVVANVAIRKWIAKVDSNSTVKSDQALSVKTEIGGGSVHPSDILQAWGKISPASIDQSQYLNTSLLKLLENYRAIGPDEYFVPINRALAEKPFSENNEFIQIGTWGDGSEVLARRNPSDSAVYLADLEDGDPKRPRKVANSVEEYLTKAWGYHQDSLRQK